MAEQLFQVSRGVQLDDSIMFLHGAGLPGAAGGDPDIAGIGSFYVDDNTGISYRKFIAGTGTTVWAAYATEAPELTGTANTGVYAMLDAVPTHKARSMNWHIEVEDPANSANRVSMDVHASHDGDGSVPRDAVVANFSVSGITRTNAGVTFLLDVRLSGTGTSQMMELWASG